MHRFASRWAYLLLVLSCALLMGAAPGEEKTALDEYVAKPDSSYEWKLINSVAAEGLTMHVLEMTSQTWLTEAEVDRPVWKHWMLVTIPDEVKHTTGLLYISGGGNGGDPPTKIDPLTAQLAKASKAVVAELKMVPNQGLQFAGENFKRTEDSLIAYTWDKFLRTGDKKWPARLPMTKSAVRAMDTITAFCATEQGGKRKIDTFMVCGGSKRGWTTWTSAIVDKRVIAIAPISIDLLNIVPSFRHHWRAYGFWAPAVGDYARMKLMDWSGTPEYQALMKIEEPFEYRSRLTMPKFIINATGDQFFLPDSSQFYYDELPAPKYLRYMPNYDHGQGPEAAFALLSYFNAVLNGTKLPVYNWTISGDDAIHLKSDIAPKEVKLWQASNPKARDFRLEKIGRVWKSTPVTVESDGSYVGKVDKPAEGFTAFMLEATYPTESGPALKFTTGVKVVPDVYPFEYEQKDPPR